MAKRRKRNITKPLKLDVNLPKTQCHEAIHVEKRTASRNEHGSKAKRAEGISTTMKDHEVLSVVSCTEVAILGAKQVDTETLNDSSDCVNFSSSAIDQTRMQHVGIDRNGKSMSELEPGDSDVNKEIQNKPCSSPATGDSPAPASEVTKECEPSLAHNCSKDTYGKPADVEVTRLKNVPSETNPFNVRPVFLIANKHCRMEEIYAVSHLDLHTNDQANIQEDFVNIIKERFKESDRDSHVNKDGHQETETCLTGLNIHDRLHYEECLNISDDISSQEPYSVFSEHSYFKEINASGSDSSATGNPDCAKNAYPEEEEEEDMEEVDLKPPQFTIKSATKFIKFGFKIHQGRKNWVECRFCLKKFSRFGIILHFRRYHCKYMEPKSQFLCEYRSLLKYLNENWSQDSRFFRMRLSSGKRYRYCGFRIKILPKLKFMCNACDTFYCRNDLIRHVADCYEYHEINVTEEDKSQLELLKKTIPVFKLREIKVPEDENPGIEKAEANVTKEAERNQLQRDLYKEFRDSNSELFETNMTQFLKEFQIFERKKLDEIRRDGQKLTSCGVCSQQIKASNLKKHVASCHSPQSCPCEVCRGLQRAKAPGPADAKDMVFEIPKSSRWTDTENRIFWEEMETYVEAKSKVPVPMAVYRMVQRRLKWTRTLRQINAKFRMHRQRVKRRDKDLKLKSVSLDTEQIQTPTTNAPCKFNVGTSDVYKDEFELNGNTVLRSENCIHTKADTNNTEDKVSQNATAAKKVTKKRIKKNTPNSTVNSKRVKSCELAKSSLERRTKGPLPCDLEVKKNTEGKKSLEESETMRNGPLNTNYTTSLPFSNRDVEDTLDDGENSLPESSSFRDSNLLNDLAIGDFENNDIHLVPLRKDSEELSSEGIITKLKTKDDKDKTEKCRQEKTDHRAGKSDKGSNDDCFQNTNSGIEAWMMSCRFDETKDRVQYICCLCEQEFKHKTSLKRHILVHIGGLKHRCDRCEKMFEHKSELEDHINCDHRGLLLHRCNPCATDYGLRSSLSKHVRRVHKEHKNKLIKSKTWTFP